MKLLIIGTLPPHTGSKNYGGVARVVWSLANVIKNRSEITIGVAGKYFRGENYINQIRIVGLEFSARIFLQVCLIMVRGKTLFPIHGFMNILRLAHAIYILKLIQTKGIYFDCIHVHHLHNQFPYAARLLGITVPIIGTVHSYHDIIMANSEIENNNNLAIINRQMRYIDCLTHVSSAVRDQALEIGVLWRCPDFIVHNGIEFFEIPNMSCFKKQIVFVGSFIQRKGITSLIDAIKEIDSQQGDLETVVWIGNGELEKKIRETSKKLNLETRFLGYLENSQVFQHLADSRVLVVPSISESFGLVYIESLFSGTPMIGYHKIVEEIRATLDLGAEFDDWMQPHDTLRETTEALALKILKGLKVKDRANYPQERKIIQAAIRQHFGWDKIASQYLEIYEEAIARKAQL